MITRIFLFIFVLGVSFGHTDKHLKMFVFPYANPQKVVYDYSMIAQSISKTIGRDIIIYTAKDYYDYMNKAKLLQYDIYVPCSICIVELLESGIPLEAIAMGYPPFKGVVIVKIDSDIDKIEHIKGKKVAAIGKYTFGGFIFLKLKLESIGINLEKENRVSFLSSMDNIIISVLNGSVDVGIVRLDVLKDVRYQDAMGKIKIIYESIDILHHPFVVAKNMDNKLKNRIKDALLKYVIIGEEIDKLGIKSIVPATNKDYYDFFKKVKMK